MKKLLRSTFGTLVVAAFLAMTPPANARGGHGGGHGGHRGGHGGHGVKHAAAAHVKGGHAALRVRGGRGHHVVGHPRGRTRYAGGAYYVTRGGNWGGYYGLGYSYPYYGYYGYRSGWDYDPCLLYTSPSPRDRQKSRMPSSA